MNRGMKVLSSRCLWECMDRTIDVGSQHLLGGCDGAGSKAHPNQELYLDWIPRGSVGEADLSRGQWGRVADAQERGLGVVRQR